MKNIFKHIPGFRTNAKWKKVVASIYYLFCILSLFSGVSPFLIIMSLPFIAFGLVDLIKHRNKAVILTLIVSILIFSFGIKLANTYPKSTTANTNINVVAPQKVPTNKLLPVKHVKTALELKAESNAKAKKIADAKIVATAKAEQAAKIAFDAKVAANAKAVEKAKIEANIKAEQAAKVAQYNRSISEAKSKSAADAKAAQVQQVVQSQANTVTQQPSSKNNSQTVYITETGKKYHRAGCRYLSRSEIAIKESSAISEGYTACSVCNP